MPTNRKKLVHSHHVSLVPLANGRTKLFVKGDRYQGSKSFEHKHHALKAYNNITSMSTMQQMTDRWVPKEGQSESMDVNDLEEAKKQSPELRSFLKSLDNEEIRYQDPTDYDDTSAELEVHGNSKSLYHRLATQSGFNGKFSMAHMTGNWYKLFLNT